MGFYKNFGKNALGADGKPNIDPVLAAFEEAGYIVEILHISSAKAAVFPSWITEFTDTFTSEWSTDSVFGRNDKIGNFQGTTRSISISMKIPSYSVVEARENMHQLEHLIANLYPSYTSRDFNGEKVHTMSGSPMVKVKFANLIKNANVRKNAVNAAAGGLSGWINNVSFSPDLESGFHHMSPNMNKTDQAAYNGVFEGPSQGFNSSHTFLPKVLDISFTLTVVHEHKLGWENQSWLANKTDSFPYGVETLSGGKHKLDAEAVATTRTGGSVAKGLIGKVFKGKASI
jgi:hypothetical protein